MEGYFVIIFSAIFANNIVLVKFLGICPFLGVSSTVSTAAGMSAAVTFVMTLATLVTSIMYKFILIPYEIKFLKTIFFILIIAFLVQMVELVMKKVSPALYQALGVYLPLITTNCAILGVAVLVTKNDYGIMQSVVFAVANAIGFGLAIIVFAGLRERFKLYGVPAAMQGAPIALITAGLLSLAFQGFTGLFR